VSPIIQVAAASAASSARKVSMPMRAASCARSCCRRIPARTVRDSQAVKNQRLMRTGLLSGWRGDGRGIEARQRLGDAGIERGGVEGVLP